MVLEIKFNRVVGFYMNSNFNLLITGGNGYLARNCARYFLERNVSVFLLTSSNEIQFEDLKSCTCFFEPEELKGFNFDIVIHSSWGGVGLNERNCEEIQRNNLDYTSRILLNLNMNSLKKFIFFGSQAEYGQYYEKISEKFECIPSCKYGLFKKLTGEYLEFQSRIHRFEFFHLRIFSIYGKDQPSKWLIPSLISNIRKSKSVVLKNPTKNISPLHINDFIKIINEICTKDIPGGIYNICHSDLISIKDLSLVISNILKTEISIETPHNEDSFAQSLVGDNQKLIQMIDEKFKLINLEEGIKVELFK